MKRFSILLFSILFCGALVGGLWFSLRPRGEPEVREIYKEPHLEQKSVKQQQTEGSKTSDTTSASNKLESPDETPRDDIRNSLLAEEGFSLEEEAAFWEWLATHQEEFFPASVNDEGTEATGLSVGGGNKKPTYAELSKLVWTFYDLQSVLASYDIEFYLGRAICPLCSDRTLSTIVNGATGRRDFWRCRNCTGGRIKDMIHFVARMEGITVYEAAKSLADSAGLLK